jgi:hypothetical protein
MFNPEKKSSDFDVALLALGSCGVRGSVVLFRIPRSKRTSDFAHLVLEWCDAFGDLHVARCHEAAQRV